MNKILIVIAIFFSLVISVHAGENLKIVTSIFPIYDIAKNIAGDGAEVTYIVPVGANPHTFEPTPSTIKQLKGLDLFIGVHPEFDGWIEKFLPENTTLQYLVDSEEKEEHHHEHHHENPHIWLSVLSGMKISQNITHWLIQLDDKNRQLYENNLNLYQEQLSILDKEIAAMFDKRTHKKFIQWHPAWDFFADDYSLEIMATIQKGHGDEPSVKDFMKLTKEAREQQVQVVVVGLNVQSKSLQALIDEIDGKLVRLDSIGEPEKKEKSTYLNLMKHNAEQLFQSLK